MKKRSGNGEKKIQIVLNYFLLVVNTIFPRLIFVLELFFSPIFIDCLAADFDAILLLHFWEKKRTTKKIRIDPPIGRETKKK